MKIAPYTQLYQRQIQYYNWTAYDTLTNDIAKILPKFPTDNRQRCGAILASILGSVASKVIGLAYEGISSFLPHNRHKAVSVLNKKTDVQCNRIHYLEDTMIMYGVYNSDTLTDLIDTVHRMQILLLGTKRLSQENYMTGWRFILKMKVCTIMP